MKIKLKEMVSFSSFVAVFVILFICSDVGKCTNTKLPQNGDLKEHGEIHRAKNLIDALSQKLRLDVGTLRSKYSSSKQESFQYLTQTNAAQNELNLLNQLKNLLNKLSGKPPTCGENLYSEYGFTASRPIIIQTGSSPLPKDYTVKVQVNHRSLIDSGKALSNGNDLRVFYQKPGDCKGKAREIDRILENMGTRKAMVLFKLQEEVSANIVDTFKYFLAYGNKITSQVKQNPEDVYLFYDDFSDGGLGKKWHRNWGSSRIENGTLELKTTKTPTGDGAEIAVFVKYGAEWKDIEVELDMMEKKNKKLSSYPGPFLRVEDSRIKNTSAWWFEYVSGQKRCTMRRFKNNKDGGGVYRGTLAKPLTVGTWVHAKYRVVDDRFSHWVNSHVIHNNTKVSSTWMISKGTFGLGCHKKYQHAAGCHTYYDNIKITKYVSIPPILSLGGECRVDLTLFHGLGTSQTNPATSCKQIHDISIHNGQHRLKNGVYWIKTAADQSSPTYCDLTNGGWTLVGKISGQVGNIYKTWLITNHEVKGLSTPVLSSKAQMSCIDARYLATNHASTVMFASGENDKGIGGRWVQWSLPGGRESATLWTHAVGQKKVASAKMERVSVKAWNGKDQVCYQNMFGIMPLSLHGGSYPSATFDTAGNTQANELCMAIGVQYNSTADGWSQTKNGYDSPTSNSVWPNRKYNDRAPFVAVWLK